MRLGVVGDLIADARCQAERAAIGEPGFKLPFQAQQDMAFDTPMVRRIAGRVLDHTDADVAKMACAPVRAPSIAGMLSIIERAAGTGLTGHSSQRFSPVTVGPLEHEATVLRLRLVIGTDAAFTEARPLPNDDSVAAPARPAARP